MVSYDDGGYLLPNYGSETSNSFSGAVGIDKLRAVSFRLSLNSHRKANGLKEVAEWPDHDLRASLLALLIQYKMALEIQFEEFIEEEDAQTI